MNNKIIYWSILFLIFSIPFAACSQNTNHAHEISDKKIDYYTCPMHPQVHEDKPGHCPICHMTLIPVYEQSTLDDAPTSAVKSSVSIDVNMQNISGIRTTIVEEREAKKVIRASASVAFDPELAVALREYQEIAKNLPKLKEAASIRLRHLGLSAEEISKIPLNKDLSTHYHLGTLDGPLWIYATLFESDAALIKGGESVAIELPDNATKIEGVLRSLSPTVDSNRRTIRARIEVMPSADRQYLRPNAFVAVHIEIPLGIKLTVPKTSVIDTGERRIVYVKQGNDQFEQRAITLGADLNNEWVVEDGLKKGDAVVSEAAFLVDSESRLRGVNSTTHQH